MMPVHNSAFELALHPWYEPLERATFLSQELGVVLATPMFGEVYTVGTTPTVNQWWRKALQQTE
jgi:hypothetical protein